MRITPAARRAVATVLIGVLAASLCVFLGRWQWHRHTARAAAIAQVEAAYDAPTVDLQALLLGEDDALRRALTDDSPLPAELTWRQVTVTGRYLPESTVLLRNRPVAGTPSYHVLVPLVLDEQVAVSAWRYPAVVVVDRGWVPTGEDAGAVPEVPDPPAGTVTVTVRLRPWESPSDRVAPEGQVQAVARDQVLAAAGLDGSATLPGYGALAAEDPAPALALGALPAPSTDYGSHLSYAFQWWLFAVAALAISVVMARREMAAPAGEAADGTSDGERAAPARPERHPGRTPRPAPTARRRGPSDEEIEDALLDAAVPGRPVQASETRSR